MLEVVTAEKVLGLKFNLVVSYPSFLLLIGICLGADLTIYLGKSPVLNFLRSFGLSFSYSSSSSWITT